MALEFTINLNGNFSGALQKANKELHETGEESKHSKKELELFEGELGKINAGALSLNFNAFQEGGHFLQFDLAEGALIAYEAIEKVVDGVIDLGKEIVKAVADAQDLTIAVDLDVGEQGAEKVDELAESFRNSRYAPKQIKEALLPILEESGNAHEDQWNDLVTAATDVAARRKSGLAGTKAALEALNEIELNPQRLRGSLKALGIKQLDYFKDLGNLLGISEKAAEAQTKAGQVKSQTLLSVALNQIAQREGGALGNATNKSSSSLGATLDRLANLKDDLFERLEKSEGIKKLQGSLESFITAMQGDVGKRFLAAADEGFAKVAEWITKITSPEGIAKIEDGLHLVAGALKEAVTIAEEFAIIWTGNKLLNGVGAFASILNSEGIIGGLKNLRGGLNAALSPVQALTIAFEAWRYAFEKISETVKELGGLKRVMKDFKDWIGGERPAVASDLANEFSPDWKKRKVTGNPVPAMAEGGIVTGPTLALIGEAGPEAVVPLGRAFGSLPESTMAGGGAQGFGAANVTYAPQFHFSGGASHEVRAQVEEFSQQHRVELKKFIDEVRAAVGG